MWVLWMVLVLLGVAIMSTIAVGHRDGYPNRVMWPLWAVLLVLSFIIGAAWPTGAS